MIEKTILNFPRLNTLDEYKNDKRFALEKMSSKEVGVTRWAVRERTMWGMLLKYVGTITVLSDGKVKW